MTERSQIIHFRVSEGLINAVSAGFFLLLAGVLFVITPGLFQGIVDFFTGFTLKSIPHLSNVLVPVPENLAQHTVVYTAAGQFSLVWGIFQIIILALRFVVGSSIGKKAETVGNVISSLGTAYLIDVLLNSDSLSSANPNALENWFVFWAALIMLIGVSLIVRAFILAAHFWFSSHFSNKT
jgi:hypothetical protein